MAWIDNLFKMMTEKKASDLHMTSATTRRAKDLQGRWRWRLKGVPKFGKEQMQQIPFRDPPGVRPQGEISEETNDCDFAYALESCGALPLRNYFVDRFGPGAVFRRIPDKILSAEQLGLPPGVMKLTEYKKGLVLVTGPTGSGKSTTLAAMIDHINATRKEHIITIEDPIEFVHPSKKCLVNQRQVHLHTNGFAPALRAVLREDPDIVLVGEMRDLETTQIAIETAETGYLVVRPRPNTSTAASTADRASSTSSSPRSRSRSGSCSPAACAGVVAQNLLRKKGGGRIAALERSRS